MKTALLTNIVDGIIILYTVYFIGVNMKLLTPETLLSLCRSESQIHTYAHVAFEGSPMCTYTYLADGFDVEAGDFATVNTSKGEKCTYVHAVSYGSAKEAPYEFSKLKCVSDVIKYGTQAHREILVKFF